MNKLIPKKILVFCLPFICCYFIIVLFLYIFNFYSYAIGSIVSDIAGGQIEVQNISILPLKGLKLNNIDFTYKDEKIMTMRSMVLGFSFRDLLSKKLILREVMVNDVDIRKPDVQREISTNILKYLSTGKPEAEGGFDVVFNQASYCFNNVSIKTGDTPEKSEGFIKSNFCFYSKGQQIRCNGNIAYQSEKALSVQSRKEASPKLTFSFNVESIGIDMIVNHIKLNYGPYALTGSGIVRDTHKSPQCDINLYMDPLLLSDISLLRKMDPKSGELVIIGRIKGPLKSPICKIEVFSPAAELAPDGEHMSADHLSSHLEYRIADNKLYVNDFSIILDRNMRVMMSGQIENIFSPFLDLQLKFSPLKLSGKSKAEKKPILLDVLGKFEDNKFLGKIDFIYFLQQHRKYIATFKDVSVLPDDICKNEDALCLGVSLIELRENIIDRRIKKNNFSQKFIFKDSYATLRPIGKTVYLDKLDVNGYQGSISGQGKINFKQKGTDYSFTLKAKNINFNDVYLTYPILCNISGVINGNILLRNMGRSEIRGGFAATDFSLAELEILDKVADFIGIESIKIISNAQIISDFDLSSGSSTIKRLDVDSNDIRLRSNFSINENKWLEGNIALSLPRAVLEESKMFKTLLKIAREREDQIDFVVHISGFMESLRIELTESDFRDKLDERVSPRIKRYIEEQVNRAIDN